MFLIFREDRRYQSQRDQLQLADILHEEHADTETGQLQDDIIRQGLNNDEFRQIGDDVHESVVEVDDALGLVQLLFPGPFRLDARLVIFGGVDHPIRRIVLGEYQIGQLGFHAGHHGLLDIFDEDCIRHFRRCHDVDGDETGVETSADSFEG